MIYDLQQTDDPRDIIHRSVQALAEGEVIGVPSETVYGVVASALCPAAVERLADLLGGAHAADAGPTDPRGRVALCARSSEAAGDFLVPRTKLARRLSERCFPGPLTLIADCDWRQSAVGMLPEPVQRVLQRFANPDAGPACAGASARDAVSPVAFRVSNHRLLSHIHRYLAAPLVWGEFPRTADGDITTASKLDAQLSQCTGTNPLPVLLDDGVSRYGGAGTIVQLSGNSWQILRKGVIQRAAMNQFVKPVIVIVCTGNTCRSPMGEALLRDILDRRFGREDVARVLSAGVAAQRGHGASPQSVEVMGRRGLDLTGHASQPLDDPLMSMADLVLTLTRQHRDAILAAWPNHKGRVFTLRRDGGDVSDPVGLHVDVYAQCADQIRDELEKWVDALDDDFFPITPDKDASEGHNGSDDTDAPSNP